MRHARSDRLNRIAAIGLGRPRIDGPFAALGPQIGQSRGDLGMHLLGLRYYDHVLVADHQRGDAPPARRPCPTSSAARSR